MSELEIFILYWYLSFIPLPLVLAFIDNRISKSTDTKSKFMPTLLYSVIPVSNLVYTALLIIIVVGDLILNSPLPQRLKPLIDWYENTKPTHQN